MKIYSTDKNIIEHIKNNENPKVWIYKGSRPSIEDYGVVTSVNLETRTLVIENENGKKLCAPFDSVTIYA